MRDLGTSIVADVDLNGTSARLIGIPPEQHKRIAKQLEQQNKKGGVLYQAVKNTPRYWGEIAAVKAKQTGQGGTGQADSGDQNSDGARKYCGDQIR